jgi:hypothetical protein
LELAGLSLSQEIFKTSCDGVVQTIVKDEFTDTFRVLMNSCKKCIWVDCD